MYKCCSSSKPCGLSQGDCDSNNECSGNLVCGKNNCQPPFPSDADCCEAGNSFAKMSQINFCESNVFSIVANAGKALNFPFFLIL